MTVEEIIRSLTLEEKVALLQGWTTWTTRAIDRLGIPALFLSDGPHGLRKQVGSLDHLGLNESLPATCFPTAATMANSWDVVLGEELGRALGREAAANDIHVLLGPGLNIKRSPLCGRNFEYFSEDPYLAGKMAAAYIRGIQSTGVAACPKHFAVNSQELRRMSVDSVVDERTLREIYLTGFEIAVKEGGANAIMSSYNRVNSVYANENSHLLQDILRAEWGFGGFVVSDWGADNDHVLGVANGSNLVMPAPGGGAAVGLVDAVRSGQLSERGLDNRLRELLSVSLPTVEAVSKAEKRVDLDAHHVLVRKCAAASVVLLENDGILPLTEETAVAIVGDFAFEPRYQGAGSSRVNPTGVDRLVDYASAEMNVIGCARGFCRNSTQVEPALVEEALELARRAQVVLLCVGLDENLEAEGMDRPSMELSPGQQALLRAVEQVNPNVVLVLSGGSPFDLPAGLRYRGAVHGYLAGQAGAGAMVDVLLGKVNPSGKLSESWPLHLEDTPCHPWFPGKERTAEHREGLYVGYRYYDTAGVPVRYPFGYGLSYTTFTYSDLAANTAEVSFTLANTGTRDGGEVVQLYISCPEGRVFRPNKELKGFAKVFLSAGESRRVTIPLDDKAFRYFNIKTGRWEIEGGEYVIHVSASVSDVRLTARVSVAGSGAPLPYDSLPSYESGKITAVSDEEFERLLGRSIPERTWGGALERNDVFCQLQYAKSLPARQLHRWLKASYEKAVAQGAFNRNIVFVYQMPFRALTKTTGKFISDAMVDDFVYWANGHFWRGLGRLARDFFRHQRRCRDYMRKLEE